MSKNPLNYNASQSPSRTVLVDPETLGDITGLNGGVERDTTGATFPSYLPRTFTYDGSNNLETITITDGADSWVRTFTYAGGNQTADSGWVKQ